MLVFMEFMEGNPGIVVSIKNHDYVTTLTKQHFADILTSLVISKDHIEGLPKFCNCKPCREEQAELLGRKIAEARLNMEGKE
jgi:hypothetical protein